jgi:hypothetical protein
VSINLVNLYVQQYATTLQLLLQQKGSRLRGTVMEGPHIGSQASPVDQVGKIAANKVTSRFGDMPRVDATTDRRWVFPTDYDLPQLIDSFDRLRLLNDPNSTYVTNALYAMGRAMDTEILNGILGTDQTGIQGATAVPFPSAQIINTGVGAAAAAGLNVEKLRQAGQLLMAAEVDPDEARTMVITAKQHYDLLREIQIISLDFNSRPVLVDGKIMNFLGFNFVHTELLPTGTDDLSGTSTQVPFYVKSGVYLGMWNDINTNISLRNDLQGIPWQAYCKGTFGATRLEEKKVGFVWCR